MAQYATDFSEFSAGAGVPTGFTDAGTAASTVSIENDGGATGGRVLRVVPATSEDGAVRWDTPGSSTILDQLVRMRANSTFGDIAFAFFGVHAFRTTIATEYISSIGSGSSLTLARRVSGSYTDITSVSISVADSEWVYIRLRFEAGSPNVLKLHASLDLANMGEGAAAPSGGWAIDTTDGNIASGAALPAVAFFNAVPHYDVDRWAVGTGGDYPTFSPPVGGGVEIPVFARHYRSRRAS